MESCDGIVTVFLEVHVVPLIVRIRVIHIKNEVPPVMNIDVHTEIVVRGEHEIHVILENDLIETLLLEVHDLPSDHAFHLFSIFPGHCHFIYHDEKFIHENRVKLTKKTFHIGDLNIAGFPKNISPDENIDQQPFTCTLFATLQHHTHTILASRLLNFPCKIVHEIIEAFLIISIATEVLHDMILERKNFGLIVNEVLQIRVVSNFHAEVQIEVVTSVDRKLRLEDISPVLSSARILQPEAQKDP